MRETIDTILDDYDGRRISRRTAVLRLGGVLAALAGAGAPVARSAEDRPPTFQATALNHIALRVSDVSRSRDFYQEHLGLTVRSQSGSESCFLDCGPDNFVALFRREPAGLDHYCYSVEGYRAADAVDRLERAGLSPHRTENRVYFDDPDGITVQVSAP